MRAEEIVILESPYAGEVEPNVAYAEEAMLDSLRREESPMLSHLLYTRVLDDNDPHQRSLGVRAGLRWRRVADRSVVYVDRGVSRGMLYGIAAAMEAGVPREYRSVRGLDSDAIASIAANAETAAAAMSLAVVPPAVQAA